MTYQDIINYWLNHPPIEVSDPAAYAELLNIVVQQTVRELSEIDPILEESMFETGYATTLLTKPFIQDMSNTTTRMLTYATETDQEIGHTLLPLTYIHPLLMNIIVLFDLKQPPAIINQYSELKRRLAVFLSDRHYSQPISLLDIIGYRNEYWVLKDWFSREIEKLILNSNKIKLKPKTTYYAMYNRYRTLEEMPLSLVRPFEELLATNLLIQFYNSDVFSGESTIRSVSISGLSVSFNVPDASSKQTVIMRLQEKKNSIISQLSIDYDDGEIGLI